MTDTRKIAIGDTVYSQHGQEAELVAGTSGEYIVRPIYEDDDGPRAGEVETWREVFRTPPAPKLDAETAAAEKRLADLQEEVRKVQAERYAFDADAKARVDRIKQHDALADLDNYLAGKITHYVTFSDYSKTVAILPVTETIERHPSSYQFGMITLYPCTNWQGVQWLLNYHPKGANYSSDSRTERVLLCCSEDEAREKAQAYLRDRIADLLEQEPAKRYYAEALITNCRDHAVDVPAELIEGVESIKRAQLVKELADHQAKAAEIEKKLAGA